MNAQERNNFTLGNYSDQEADPVIKQFLKGITQYNHLLKNHLQTF